MIELKLRNSNKVTTISDESYPIILDHRPTLHLCSGRDCVMAYSKKLKRSILFHRLLFIADNSHCALDIDHIDRNPLNNCLYNLRFCSVSENHANRLKPSGHYTSKYKGVHKKTGHKKFVACIKVNKKFTYLGSFLTEDDAGLAYNKASLKYYGKFAVLNTIS